MNLRNGRPITHIDLRVLIRLLIALVALAAIISFAQLSASHERNSWANKPLAPIVSGSSVGQTIYSRYGNLTGIEAVIGTYGRGASVDRAALLLTVRDAKVDGPVIATATLSPRVTLAENSWFRFSFAPIADSEGKNYYLEITSPEATTENALTLYWWESDPSAPTDPYVDGTAFVNRQPAFGDLAFGAIYAPSALSALAQMARAATTNISPYWLVLLVSLLLVLSALVLFAQPLLIPLTQFVSVDSRKSRRLLIRLSLPIALGVGLGHGLLYLWLIPPWHGPDEHGHLVYAALLDRHGLDDAAVQGLEWWEGGRDRSEIVALKKVVWASMLEHDWTRLLAGYPAPGSTALPAGSDPIFTEFIWQTNQPPAYYWLSALSFRAARAIGISADPFSHPDTALLVMRGLSLGINLAIIALAWLASKLLASATWLRLLLPLTVALLPMHSFINAAATNDSFAELSIAALFVAVIVLFRHPSGFRGALTAVTVTLLALLSLGAKGTAVVAAAPLAGLALLFWLVHVAWQALTRRLNSHSSSRKAVAQRVGPLAAGLLVVILYGVGPFLLFEQDTTAAAWQIGAPSERPQRLAEGDAKEGEYALELNPGETAYQWVDLRPPPVPISLTLGLWVRAQNDSSVLPRIAVVVDQRGRLPVHGVDALGSTVYGLDVTPVSNDVWSRAELAIPVTPGDRKLKLQLLAGGSPTSFDALTLEQSSASDTGGAQLLGVANPSFEQGARRLHLFAARLLPGEYREYLDVLVNPQAFDKWGIWQRYGVRQFKSFWGNFGWVSIPLPDAVYSLIAVTSVLSLVGLLLIVLRRWRGWRWQIWLGLISLVSLAVAIVMGFTKQMAPMVTTGEHTDPAGRYLFVLLTPIIWLLLSGLGALWTLVARLIQARRVETVTPSSPINASSLDEGMPWGVWLLCLLLFTFAIYCLAVLVAPYYYG